MPIRLVSEEEVRTRSSSQISELQQKERQLHSALQELGRENEKWQVSLL